MISGKVEANAKTNETGFKVNNTWYNAAPGQTRPKFNEIVSFEVVKYDDGKDYASNITVTGSASSGGGGGFRKGGGGSKYDHVGQQIGNAVTNATNLIIASGVINEQTTPNEIAQRVGELALKIAKVSTKVRAGFEAEPQAAPAPAAPVQQVPGVSYAQPQATPQPAPAPAPAVVVATPTLASSGVDFSILEDDFPF